MSEYGSHYSVLNKEIIDLFKENVSEKENSEFADMTFGAGGHSLEILKNIPGSKVTSVDQDPEALANGQKIIDEQGFSDRIELLSMNFESFPAHINSSKSFDGIVMDLGVSSHHFDTAERGFSFRFDGPLDMRMDTRNDDIPTAAQVLNTYSAKELEEILFEYGEEKQAKVIVKNILEAREKKPFETTKQLEDICFHSYPKKMRHGKTNPATKTFQALRIHINNELGVLQSVIPGLANLLEMNGLLAIITFHSLEDRICKKLFKNISEGEIPFDILTKKPILPTESEILENSRSRSAKLRVIKRVNKKRSKNKYERFSTKEK